MKNKNGKFSNMCVITVYFEKRRSGNVCVMHLHSENWNFHASQTRQKGSFPSKKTKIRKIQPRKTTKKTYEAVQVEKVYIWGFCYT